MKEKTCGSIFLIMFLYNVYLPHINNNLKAEITNSKEAKLKKNTVSFKKSVIVSSRRIRHKITFVLLQTHKINSNSIVKNVILTLGPFHTSISVIILPM